MKSALLLSATILFAASSAFAGTVIPTGPFKSVELHGGGFIMLHNGGAQVVTLNAGSTQFTKFHIEDGDKLVIDACNEDCPHNYELRIDIATPRIDGAAVEGGGEIMGSGDLRADHFSAAINGGGRVDMRAVQAADVNAAVNGGGQIKVSAAQKLNAVVSGGGLIEYWGDAQVTRVVSGGGDIRQGS
jgi:hypothetical protein